MLRGWAQAAELRPSPTLRRLAGQTRPLGPVTPPQAPEPSRRANSSQGCQVSLPAGTATPRSPPRHALPLGLRYLVVKIKEVRVFFPHIGFRVRDELPDVPVGQGGVVRTRHLGT